MKTFVIINPAAGGRTRRRWHHDLADQLFARIGLFEYELTNGAGAATLLAGRAIADGYTRLIAVGGDGTVNEVVNGMLASDGMLVNPEMVLGCLPAGSGTDFWKSAGLPEQVTAAMDRLCHGTTLCCDVGRVSLVGHDGRSRERFFCNMADVGLGGVVVDRARRLPRITRGSINYGVAAFMTAMQWTPQAMQITIDGRTVPVESLLVTCIANGAYCGGGMCIAPRARLDSGFFECVRMESMSWGHMLQVFPALYTGRAPRHDRVHVQRAREITIASETPLNVTLDGEVPGTVPATFTIIPQAIRVLV